MTAAAISQTFSQAPAAGSPPGGAAKRQGHDDAEATPFDDLVHGNGRRDGRTATPRPGEAKTVSAEAAPEHDDAEPDDARTPRTDGHGAGRVRHPHKTGSDDPDGDEADDAAPLRDRLSLLVALNGFGHHATSPSAATGNEPERRSPAGQAAVARAGSRPAGLKGPADRAGTGLPDDAERTPAPPDPAAGAVASAAQRPSPKGTAAPLPPTRPASRADEDGDAPSGTAAKPHAARGAADRPTDAPASILAQSSPAASDDDTSPDGHQGTGGDGAAAAKAGRQVASRDEPSPDPVARSGTEGRASGTVTVTADRSFPAPAAHPLSPTTAGVIEALAAARAQAAAGLVSQPPQAAGVAHPTQVLRIELHPAELGVVTASLRLSGEQLSIELKPETAEAYRRLTHDSDTIVDSLRKLGLDVDSVKVMQPSIAAQPAARVDAGNQSSSLPGRDAGQFQPGTPGGSGDGFGGNHSGRNRSHDGQPPERPAPTHRQRTGGTLFI